MAQWLRALAVLAEDLGSVLSAHTAAHLGLCRSSSDALSDVCRFQTHGALGAGMQTIHTQNASKTYLIKSRKYICHSVTKCRQS